MISNSVDNISIDDLLLKEGDGEYELEIPNDFGYVRYIRDFIAEKALAYGFNEERCTDIQIIADELCNNAIEHGSPILDKTIVRIMLKFSNRELNMTIKDTGKGGLDIKESLSEDEKKHLEFRQELSSIKRGRGLFLVRELSDEYDFDINPETGSTIRVVIRCT